MTETEIYSRLTALHIALVGKLGAQPYLAPRLSMDTKCHIAIYDSMRRNGGTENILKLVSSETIAGCLDAAGDFIVKMPDRKAKAKHDWHRKLGNVIDEGRALALPDEVMQPLRAGSQAMIENLLTHAELDDQIGGPI